MELAVHYSPDLDTNRVRWDHRIDRVKVGPWTPPAVLHRYRARCILHGIDDGFVLSTRERASDDVWERVKLLVDVTGTPWLSDHIAFACGDARVEFVDGQVRVTGRDELSRAEAIRLIVAGITAVRQHSALPFLGENLDYVDIPAYRYISEPVFITEVVEASACGLLLDTAHARIAADWLDVPIEHYLSALPLARMREIHFNGPRVVGAHLYDAHAPATDEDYRVLAWVLDRARPDMITLEYRGPALEHELEHLERFLKDRGLRNVG